MGQGYYRSHKTHSKNASKKYLIDHVMFIIALVAPIMTIPQLLEIWVNRKVAGVAVATWAAYTFVSFMWLWYGIVHKEKPVILTNLLLLVFDALIVLGVFIFH